MDVTLEPQTGRNLATGKRVTFEQYRVRLDGQVVGYIAWKPGSKLCLIERVGPVELRELEAEVARQLQVASAESLMVPDVPADMLQPDPDDPLEDLGDFDDVDT